MKIKAYDIDWDVDENQNPDLPKTCTVIADKDFNPSEELADVLTDRFGFLVNGCKYKILKQ